jgi:gamma-glutamylcysteine synthetase
MSARSLDLSPLVSRFAEGFGAGPIGLRKVGREAEYPLVSATGEAFDVAALWDELAEADAHGPALDVQKAPGGMVVGLEGVRFSYASEVGRGTIELITGPRHDLCQLAEDHEAGMARLVEVAARHGAWVLGVGTQPLSPPTEALMTAKPRYQMLLDRIGPDWLSFAVTCSDQLHVDVAEPEVVAMTNLGNILSPVVIALCGNSPVLGGADSGACCWREAGMGAIEAAAGRHGMPHTPIESLEQHIERIVDLPHLLNKIDGVAEPATDQFRDFLRALGTTHSEEAYAAFAVQDHYVWHSARPRSRQGTVELRAACQQPWDGHMAAAALGLGIIAGGAEIGGYLNDVLGLDGWERMRTWHGQVVRHGLAAPPPVEGLIEAVLDRVQAALRGRGRREEYLLAPLFRRLASGENPGQLVRRVFADQGMGGLIAHCRIPASLG